jgi:hypothetical protein
LKRGKLDPELNRGNSMPMSDETRTTRLTLLAAGNGFIFVKCLDTLQEDNMTVRTFVSAILLAVVSLVGVSAAYISLRWYKDQRRADRAEWISVVCIGSAAIYFFLMFAYVRSGISPHPW